jgi:hypothetical protein
MANDWGRGGRRGRGRGRSRGGRWGGRGGRGSAPPADPAHVGPPAEAALELRLLAAGPDFDDKVGDTGDAAPPRRAGRARARSHLALAPCAQRPAPCTAGSARQTPALPAESGAELLDNAGAGGQERRLRLADWRDLGRVLAWFREGCSACAAAELAFSPALSKEHRAQARPGAALGALARAPRRGRLSPPARPQVHAAASAAGLGGLQTVSRGLGEERYVSVVRQGAPAGERPQVPALARTWNPLPRALAPVRVAYLKEERCDRKHTSLQACARRARSRS